MTKGNFCERPKELTIGDCDNMEKFISEVTAAIRRNAAYGAAVVIHTEHHVQSYQFGLDGDEMLTASVVLDRFASDMFEEEGI